MRCPRARPMRRASALITHNRVRASRRRRRRASHGGQTRSNEVKQGQTRSNEVKRGEVCAPLNPLSLSYTQIRTKNSNFNPAFYGKPMNTILRTDLDEDWDVKPDCHNKYPSMSHAEMMNNIP